ncbi:MAG: copper homeostasis protein CutC [Nocardioides sp.]
MSVAAGGVLEVAVLHAADARGAQEGGADRVYAVAPSPDGWLSPDLPTASAIIRAVEVPVWVQLRLNDSLTTTGGEFSRLIGLGEEFVALGAAGLCFGFLDHDLEIDRATCTALADALPEIPWMFHRGFDQTLDLGRAWRQVSTLPGLVGVMSAGSPSGSERGLDELLGHAANPAIARWLVATGGLTPEQVPWLARAGVRQFQIDLQARPTGSLKAYVDSGLVRTWRDLIDSQPTSG